MWRPTEHAPEAARALPRRAGTRPGSGAVVCHALYLVNLASPDPEIYEKSVAAMRASLETASGDRRRRRSSSTSARTSAPGFDGGSRAGRPGAARAARADDRRPLAPARELAPAPAARSGARPTSSPTLYDGARPASAPRDLPRLVPLVGVGRRRHRPARARRGRRRARRAHRPRPAALPPRQRLGGGARVEPRPARLDRARADRRRARRRSWRTPPSRSSPRSSRPPGPDGSYAGELARLRDLHRTVRGGRQALALGTSGQPASASQSTVAKTRKLGRSTRELEELRVAAADLVVATLVARRRPRRRTSGAAPSRLARRRSPARRPSAALEQVEVDLDVEHLLHAPHVRVPPRLVGVDERARHRAMQAAGVHDLVAVHLAAAALDLVLRPQRELRRGRGAGYIAHAGMVRSPGALRARLDSERGFQALGNAATAPTASAGAPPDRVAPTVVRRILFAALALAPLVDRRSTTRPISTRPPSSSSRRSR